MKVLGIESSAGVASVAITAGGKVLSGFTTDSGSTHSATLLPMIEASLKVVGMKVSDVDVFALSAGPGSFTGVRIGAATVKGLAVPNGTPCVGVSSLEAMAENLRSLPGIICPVINARSGRVYTALFETDGVSAPRRLTDDDVMTLDDLAALTEKYEGANVYLTGDAYGLAKEKIRSCETPLTLQKQNAVGVAALGERKFLTATGAEREAMTADALSVIYLRKPQAEREREERLAKEGDKNER